MTIDGEPLQPSTVGTSTRRPQLAYSEHQHLTYDEAKRRRKAVKIRRVITDFIGRSELSGLVVVDLGCSTGFTCAELHAAGADVIGMDIDIPGLSYANQRFGTEMAFIRADGSSVPFPDQSVDIIVFNHIYEHVVDPDKVMSEIKRVLRTDGVAYLGLGNKYGIIEPHYRLPFLSWIPRPAADRYVRAAGRAPEYYERFRSRSALRRMSSGLNTWDYTYTLLCDPDRFNAQDMVPGLLAKAPERFWRLLGPIMPTYIWLGTPGDRRPPAEAHRAAPVPI